MAEIILGEGRYAGMNERQTQDPAPEGEARPAPGQQFTRLVELVARLRGPDGCPWDRAQTHLSLRPYVLEEAYEVADALDGDDPEALCEELGDLLLQVLLHSEIGREAGTFDISDCLEGLSQKLIRRHPHVFGTEDLPDPAAVQRRWAEIKAKERADGPAKSPAARTGWLDAVPMARPAVEVALHLGKRAAEVGFDWADPESVFGKIREELAEVEAALRERPSRSFGAPPADDAVAREIGDLLFAVINLARLAGVDPEGALAGTNRKFRTRFRYVEEELAKRGIPLGEASLDEMEAMWQAAKKVCR
ncbi:MAG: nucleoside triphosphate pyrophosphohydrolase [Kyrpidia sp.]|nr:nucleoside triphosphate pyrophosphohydrolase [Kyrpidia sp.]